MFVILKVVSWFNKFSIEDTRVILVNEGEIIDFSFIRFFFSISLMYIDLLKRETTLTDEVFLS